jgi:hypothetical protein
MAHWLRVFSAEAAGGEVTGLERYEVLLSEVKEDKALAAW